MDSNTATPTNCRGDALEAVAQGCDGHGFCRRVNLGLEHAGVGKPPKEGHEVRALAFGSLYLGECCKCEQGQPCEGE